MKDNGSASRLLVHVPIVHSRADMGSSSERVRAAYIEQKGSDAWEESRQAIDRFWRDLEEKIASLDLDLDRVRLYQDALPVCGHEAEIVRDLAAAGGVNYRILAGLMARGATLEGTESPELLLQEYRLLKAGEEGAPAVQASGVSEEPATSALATLLDERDRYIVERIDATLRPGEIGILFLGALHGAVGMLPAIIQVVSLDEFLSGGGRS